MTIELDDYQIDAIGRMKTGCILNGGVGSGKSRTALAYYYVQNGGTIDPFTYMKKPKDLYIITTARKRDDLEWDEELVPFLISTNPKHNKKYGNKIVIDSWNNIKKYIDVRGAFFIFDEDRVTGKGEWVKTFYKIAEANEWVILSATPGDTWSDYIPVFVANGFYKNRTDFNRQHVIYSPYITKFPKIDRYVNTKKLERNKAAILIEMDFVKHTVHHDEDIIVKYDILQYRHVFNKRWNPYTNKPIKNASELCSVLRKIVNSDETRQTALLQIFEKHPKIIVFYNFTYELEILKGLYYGEDVEIAEWNGLKHEPIPTSDKWVYLVQYNACEGWNCILTDTIVFYSQNYSYKVMHQASGRIDRRNTPYTDLYYYHLKSKSAIDIAISRAITNKKKFNERKFTKW